MVESETQILVNQPLQHYISIPFFSFTSEPQQHCRSFNIAPFAHRKSIKMSDPPQRQQPPVGPARVRDMSDIRYLSYEVPNPNPIAGHGPVREEIEVHVHPGANNFQLANMRATSYRPPRPPTRRINFGNNWPDLEPGTPQRSLDGQVTATGRHRAALEENSRIHIESPSGAPTLHPAPEGSTRPATALGSSGQNMPVNPTIAAGSPSYRQFLARIAAAERNAPLSAANPGNGRPATPRPRESRTSLAQFSEYLESFSPAHNFQQESETLNPLHVTGTNLRDNFLSNAARVNISSGSPLAPSTQLAQTLPQIERPVEDTAEMLWRRRLAARFRLRHSIAGGDSNHPVSSRRDEIPSPSSADDSRRGMPAAYPWSDRGPIMRQRSPNSLEDVRSHLALLEGSRQSFLQPGEDSPSMSASASPAAERSEGERSIEQTEEEGSISSNFIYPAPGNGMAFELDNVLPPDVLALIAADPNIETRSLFDDIGWIGYDSVPHLHDYRYRLLPDGTVGVRQPPVVVEEAARRRTGHDERVRAVNAAQADAQRATQDVDLAARLALPAEVELRSSLSVSSRSPALPQTDDEISAAENSTASPAINHGDSQETQDAFLASLEAESDGSEISDNLSSISASSISVVESDYIDGIMDVPRGRMGCSCPECNGRFSFL
ncbi:hypothetical protein DL98DRAFT_630061 [Cadophora sp. DSE1049]|nr:hypothetical protein DL98DRAFT_630061 [Cadophora sp. DSE1049]